jgi:Zn-dependent alcohol dehydrogenase
MLTKQQIIESAQNLPDKIELEDLIEHFILLEKINKGLDDVKNGRVYSHDEAKQRLSKWLK